MADTVEVVDLSTTSSEDQQRLSRLDSEKMRITSADRRSPSPGVAKRIVDATSVNGDSARPDSTANAADIDDLSKKLADSLLDATPTVTQPNKYVSMNDQKKMDDEPAPSRPTQPSLPGGWVETPAAVHDSRLTESISINRAKSAVSNGSQLSDSNLTNGVGAADSHNLSQTLQFDLWESKDHDLDNPFATRLDSAATPNIAKPVNGVSTISKKPVTNFDTGKDLNGLVEDNLISTEVDVLTAISAQATPSSLPNVLDGLSDGEVSSDDTDDDNDDDDSEITSHTQHTVSWGLVDRLTRFTSPWWVWGLTTNQV